jgi:hypothetical protein
LILRSAAVASMLVIALGLTAVVVWDFAAATALVVEDGPVEWLQVALCAAAAVLNIHAAARRPRRRTVLDLLVVAGLLGIIIGEVDLDKRIFGVKVISTKFMVDGRIPPALRVLGSAIVIGVPAAIAVYALRRIRELWSAGIDALGHTHGQVLLAAVLLFGTVDLVEGLLNHVLGFPRFFAEETLELIATAWFFIAALGRWGARDAGRE